MTCPHVSSAAAYIRWFHCTCSLALLFV
jgi:hypothetical protein